MAPGLRRTNFRWSARRWHRAFPGARLYSWEDSASGRGFLFGNERLVEGSVHQAGNFGGIGELDFDEPRGAVRIRVQGFGSAGQRGIGFRDFAGYRGENLADRLDRFHRAEHLSGRDLRADRWHFHEDDVAQFMLRVVGDPDRASAAGDFDPLVFLGVAVVAWVHYGSL